MVPGSLRGSLFAPWGVGGSLCYPVAELAYGGL